MRAERVSEVRTLRGLKNIAWLRARQLDRLAYVWRIVDSRRISNSPQTGTFVEGSSTAHIATSRAVPSKRMFLEALSPQPYHAAPQQQVDKQNHDDNRGLHPEKPRVVR